MSTDRVTEPEATGPEATEPQTTDFEAAEPADAAAEGQATAAEGAAATGAAPAEGVAADGPTAQPESPSADPSQLPAPPPAAAAAAQSHPDPLTQPLLPQQGQPLFPEQGQQPAYATGAQPHQGYAAAQQPQQPQGTAATAHQAARKPSPRTSPIVWGALILVFCAFVAVSTAGGSIDPVVWLIATIIGLGSILLIVGIAVLVRSSRERR